MHRRDLLRTGSLLAGAALPGRVPGEALAVPRGGMQVEATRASMAASAVLPAMVVYLAERGRAGMFTCVAGETPPGDPLQGLYVPGSAGRYFARLWDRTNGRPEWFGARTDDWRFDCADAIEACFAACPVTQLGQADYFLRRTLVLDRSWRTMVGTGTYATDQGQGTRIILQGQASNLHDGDIMRVGSARQPGRTNDSFPFEIHLARFTLIRDGTSAPHPSGDLRRYPAGLRASFLTRCSFTGIASLENSVGIYLGGTVYTKVDDCLAQRLGPGSGGGPDLAAGFFLDGSPEFGLAGGNASLYLSRCLAVGQHARHVRPTGLIAEGAFVDSFIDGFESARIDNGIRLSAHGAPRPTQTIDLHVRNCVLDGCGATGLELDLTGTQAASVEIVDPYIYSAGGGGARGIVVRDGGGLVTLTGGQVHGDFREGSLLLQQTRGVRVQGLKIHESSQPVMVRGSGALQLEPQISNLTRQTAKFAVTAVGVYRSAFRPMIIGAPGMLAGGVWLDAACNYSSVDGTAIDPGCFGEVSARRKLWFGGADATRGSGATEFARQGNIVTGVLG